MIDIIDFHVFTTLHNKYWIILLKLKCPYIFFKLLDILIAWVIESVL